MKDNRWVSIGGHKQKVSELPYDLRLKLDLLDEPEEVVKEKTIEKVVVYKDREPEVKRERSSVGGRRKENKRKDDSGMSVILGMIGRWLNKRSR